MRTTKFLASLGLAGLTYGLTLAACDSSDSGTSSGAVTTTDASFEGSVAQDSATPPAADSAAPVDAGSEAATDAAVGDGGDGGTAGGALHFAGGNQSVIVTVTGGGNESAFTAELWFRTTSLTTGLFEVFGAGADRMLSINAGLLCWYVYGPGTQICSPAGTSYADGNWHHIAGSVGGTGGMQLYIDGAPVASGAKSSSTFTGDTAFQFGGGHTAFNSAVSYMLGDIDEVRVWSVERSAAEIAASYTKTVDPATVGLQGYWKLDETGTTKTAPDSTTGVDSGVGHVGALTNFTPASTPWVAGKL